MFREFEEDPFFSGIQFPSIFGPGPFGSEFGTPHHPRHALTGRTPGTQLMMPGFGFGSMWPFGGEDPFQRMNSMFRELGQQQGSSTTVHSFSSSSVMHYSSDGSEGAPKVFHASSSTMRAPGGVSETRKSMRDSESGVQKASIGHHIGERSHVMEKSLNVKTKDSEETQNLVNMDEGDVGEFNREWRTRLQGYKMSPRLGQRQRAKMLGLPGPSSSSSAGTSHHNQHHHHRHYHQKPSSHAHAHNSSSSTATTAREYSSPPYTLDNPNRSSARAAPSFRVNAPDVDGGCGGSSPTSVTAGAGAGASSNPLHLHHPYQHQHQHQHKYPSYTESYRLPTPPKHTDACAAEQQGPSNGGGGVGGNVDVDCTRTLGAATTTGKKRRGKEMGVTFTQ